eukprot:758974-Hanusia_phi.AAC.9
MASFTLRLWTRGGYLWTYKMLCRQTTQRLFGAKDSPSRRSPDRQVSGRAAQLTDFLAGGQKGDLVITFDVVYPKHLSLSAKQQIRNTLQ